MTTPASNQLFSTMAARTSLEDAAACLWQHYGLRGVASPLNSERDENFHIRADNGQEYVLKFTHPAEDPGVTDFQTRALMHAAQRDPELPIARIMPRLDGEPYGRVQIDHGPARILRLYSYLQGTPLHQISRTPAQRRHLGMTLARLNIALQDFSHPSAGHELLWDIQHSERLKPLMDGMPVGPRRDLSERFMHNFETVVQPRLASLRKQVIHNDLNPYNVLVDPHDHTTTAGLIDFGDMVHAPLANELGVACSYQLSQNENPLDTAAELIAGYHAVNPLRPDEIDLLYDLIAARLLMTVTITGWRARQYPENETYILRNNRLSWDGLERIAAVRREDAQRYLRHICEMEN
ncbi:phosphotransferase [Leeia oryzae]|uniref:phosphotransferase n=1 Tax=Leeia oryzae TaxID=356662 RepID=UPI00037E7837|nr:phosphotransferase [Leeia oryzae]